MTVQRIPTYREKWKKKFAYFPREIDIFDSFEKAKMQSKGDPTRIRMWWEHYEVRPTGYGGEAWGIFEYKIPTIGSCFVIHDYSVS